MTQPVQPRPQPVVREFNIQGAVSGLIVAIGEIAFIVRDGITVDNLFTLGNLVATVISIGLGAYVWYSARVHGQVAAAQVTPLESPQDYRGNPLMTAEQWERQALRAGKHSEFHAPVPEDPAPTQYYQRLGQDQRPTPYPRAPRPLGRIVRHDPRSLRYLVPETDTVQSVMWERKTPILDQGSLGSCTGNATVGVLGSTPFWDTLAPTVRAQLDETEAVKVYSLATELDDIGGTYPPNDTGSSGLGAAQAAKALGLISGYQHIVSVPAAHTAIQRGPFIVGVNWYEGFDNPDANGVVEIGGQVRGGHEFEIIGYDAVAGRWQAINSWGTSYGVGGRFSFSDATFARLLAEQGDGTVFVPITQPAPTPTPGPTLGFPLTEWEAWKSHPRSVPKTLALIKAITSWLAGTQ